MATSSFSVPPRVKILKAETEEHFQQARSLFQKYADWLGVDLSYQQFDQELESLSKMYGGDEGCLLLAYANELLAGCVSLRKFEGSVCEMKRLYVQPAFQGKGIGSLLAKQIVQEAKILRYTEMVLDTLEKMKSAHELYRSLGFEEIPAYYANPLPNVIYLKLSLINDKK